MSTTGASSRFVSEAQLTEAQKKREEAIKDAYARIGQSPPPGALNNEEEYDPRSLAEKLKANKDAKQEIFEEKMKLSNHFRGIDDGESDFLAQVAKEKMEEQRRREEETRQELEAFRQAALLKEASPPGPVGSIPSSTKSNVKSEVPLERSAPAATKTKGKRKREGLLGVVKKKPAIEEAAKTSEKEGGDAKIKKDSLTE